MSDAPVFPKDEGPLIESGIIAVPDEGQPTLHGSEHRTKCCVVGGGPAGVMLSYLLARQGIPVILLEAHQDFDRKFRGDTIHPSVLEVMAELGLSEKLHELPHTKVHGPTIETASGPIRPVNFARLKTEFPYVMLVPQVAFLDFMVQGSQPIPKFPVEDGGAGA